MRQLLIALFATLLAAADQVPPRVIHKVDPTETAVAKASKAFGVVVVAMEISAEGVPENLTVKSGIDPALDANTIECVKQWRFEPATKDGTPIRMKSELHIGYKERYRGSTVWPAR